MSELGCTMHMYMVSRTSVGINPHKKFLLPKIQSLLFIAPLIHLRGLKFFCFLHSAGESSQWFCSIACLVCWSCSSSYWFSCTAFLKVHIQVYLFASDTSFFHLLKNVVLIVHNWHCCSWCKIIVGRCHSPRRHKKALLTFGNSIRVSSNRCRLWLK